MGIGPVHAGEEEAAPGHPARRALRDAAHHLKGRALKLAGYLLVAYVVLKVIPALKDALDSLERVSWEWVAAAIGLEILSETGFVVAWSAIVDPRKMLGRGGRGRHMDEDVAWAQLGGGLVRSRLILRRRQPIWSIGSRRSTVSPAPSDPSRCRRKL